MIFLIASTDKLIVELSSEAADAGVGSCQRRVAHRVPVPTAVRRGRHEAPAQSAGSEGPVPHPGGTRHLQAVDRAREPPHAG